LIAGKIVEYAQQQNVDIIVVGTKGRSSFKRLLLGSVALGVVTYAHCPVMITKELQSFLETCNKNKASKFLKEPRDFCSIGFCRVTYDIVVSKSASS